MKYFFSALLISTVTLLLAACGGGGGATPDSSGNLTIELSEYKFSPDNIELKVGQKVTFTLKNMGEKDHEFMVGRNVMMKDGAPSTFEHNLFEGMEPMVMRGGQMAEGMDHGEEGMEGMEHGFMVDVPQDSKTATLTFTVTEDMVGEWEIGCFEDNGQHYDEGMKGKLVVTK